MKQTMLKMTALALVLAWAPISQSKAEPVLVDAVGFDVAADALVIHGAHFALDETAAPPEVLISGVPAKVLSWSEGFLTVQRPAGLTAGEHRLAVQRRGLTDDEATPPAEFAFKLTEVDSGRAEPSDVAGR